MLAAHEERRGEQFWQGADLVMEVVSPNDRERDEVVKKEEYARVGIAEYWLVDPQNEEITVFWLQDGRYTPTAYTKPETRPFPGCCQVFP